MKEEISNYAKMFDILSNEVRLCILINLYCNESKKVMDLQDCANVSQSVISQQLSKLRALGIISARKVGNEVYYSINGGEVKELMKRLELDRCQDE